jgi:hypothetical protein
MPVLIILSVKYGSLYRCGTKGEPVSKIAEYFAIGIYEVSFLIIHCELEGWIEPREGGLAGTKKHKWKKGRREKMKIG